MSGKEADGQDGVGAGSHGECGNPMPEASIGTGAVRGGGRLCTGDKLRRYNRKLKFFGHIIGFSSD